MKKRGMSDVVTTLIIILLAIVAVGVVWVVVKGIVDKGSDEITLTGLTLDLDITKAIVEDDTLDVTVKRNKGEGDLVGINFVISDGDNSVVVRRNTNLPELRGETFTFTLSTLAVGEITSISVAPIFKVSSGKEATGEILDTITSDSGDLGTGDASYTGTPGGEDPGEDPGEGNGCDPVCVLPEVCVNENCVLEGCIPEQTCVTEGFDCETFVDDCFNTIDCGDCTGTEECINNICVEDICVPLDNLTACTNAGYGCGVLSNIDTCGLNVNCSIEFGTCSEQNPEGNWKCIDYNCTEITYVNSGTVAWFGPPDVTRYFSSASLPPPDETNYENYFVTFPDVAPDCYYILNYNYDFSVYEYVIIELLLDVPLSINFGDSYEIWESYNDCCNNLPNCVI